MTQEDKQLLLKDLCARLPYGVKFPYHIDEDSNHKECDCIATMDEISEDTVEFYYKCDGRIKNWSCIISEVKPYLRQMSSMTEEEKMHFWCLNHNPNTGVDFMTHAPELIDWLNENHFDYRGLIPMKLALEAPENMYKTE